MRVYFIVFVLTFLAQFFHIKSEKQYWWRTVVSFIPLFLFMALRQDFGSDEGAYHYYFDMVHRTNNIFLVSDHMEMGYAVLNKIMPSYQILIVFTSFLSCWAFSYVIYSFVPHKYSWLAIALLFLASPITIIFMISGIRNGIAASLLILSCYFIKIKKPMYFALMGVLATSIHTSALFMFLVCFLLKEEKPIGRKESVYWSIPILIASFSSLSSLTDAALPFITYISDRYEDQVLGMAEIADERGVMGFLLGMALAAGILIYQNMMKPKDSMSSISDDCKSFKYKYALFYAFSFCLGTLGGRMSQYMIYFFIVAATSMFAYWKNTLFKYVYILVVFVLYRITLMNWMNHPDFNYTIYKSIFGNF